MSAAAATLCDVPVALGPIVDAVYEPDATVDSGRDRRVLVRVHGDVAQIFIECRAAAGVNAARARARDGEADSVSDAGPEIAARLRVAFAPLEDDVPAARHLALRTDQPVEHAADGLVAGLDRVLLARATEAQR